MIVWRDDSLLLIERGREPWGFAPPAGHVDGDASFEEAARRELREEVGLEARKLELVASGTKQNPCRRAGGSWHFWKIYRVDANGEVRSSPDEVKKFQWCSPQQVCELAKKTTLYREGRISEIEWRDRPGLEPVWADWLGELGVVGR